MSVQDSIATIQTLDIQQRYRISAPASTVFAVLTTRIGEWWTHPYRLHDGEAAIQVDGRPGGMVAERWDGNFASWGTVTRYVKDSTLEFSGQCGMDGAVYGLVRFTLSEEGEETVLELSHKAFGMMGEDTLAGYEKGWRTLLTNLQALSATD